MRASNRIRLRRLVAACAAAAALLVVAGAAAGQAVSTDALPPRPQPLGSFQITAYWFVPEAWFSARKIVAPGLSKPYREDFLYSARGVAMQGTGTGADGVSIHWQSGRGAWVNADGAETYTSEGGFTNGPPYARPGGCVWWRRSAKTGEIAPKTADMLRPTFPNPDGTWQNAPADRASYEVVCDRAAARAYVYKVGKPFKDDRAARGYPDTFGIGIGTDVQPWHSIATDPSVIPTGSHVYVEALKDTPAKGCFTADDTGGAIIGNHIDVLIPPDKSLSLPGHGDIVLLPDGVPCPPPRVLPVGRQRTVKMAYLVPASEAVADGTPVPVAGLRDRTLREDFLYGTSGVVARLVGRTGSGGMLRALGGGWWVDAAGRRTTLQADGSWSAGAPFWRDGGWRTRKGVPTYKRADGTWAHGVGVKRLRYHDRFTFARKGVYVPWKTVVSRKGIAPIGTVLKIGGIARASCTAVTRLNQFLPAGTVQLVVPPGTDPSKLPATATLTVLKPVRNTPYGCPAR